MSRQPPIRTPEASIPDIALRDRSVCQMSQQAVPNRTLASTGDYAAGRLCSEVAHFAGYVRTLADRPDPVARLVTVSYPERS